MSLVKVNWRPGPRELRVFGAVLLVGFAALGGLAWAKGRPTAAAVLWALGGVVGVLGLSGTRAAWPAYWAWMGFAFVMGNIMGRLLLGVVYYGLITPMGLTMRLLGRDPLQLRRANRPTCWLDVKGAHVDDGFERQF